MLNRWCRAAKPAEKESHTTLFGVEDVEQCCATSRHIFMAALFPQAAPLCGLSAVKHSLPSPMALLCHGIPTSARDFSVYSKLYYHIVFSLEFFFSVKAPLCWVCNRSTVGFGGKHLPVPKRQQFQRHSGVARCRMCCIRCVVCFEQTAHLQMICSCARGGGIFATPAHISGGTQSVHHLYMLSRASPYRRAA